MNRRKAVGELLKAIVETGAEFRGSGGVVIVGDITFTCREDYIVVSTEQVTSFFQYETLEYISSQGDSVCIADTHVGVFATYKVGEEMHCEKKPVFSEEKFYGDNEISDVLKQRSALDGWPERCDGKTEEECNELGFMVHPDWIDESDEEDQAVIDELEASSLSYDWDDDDDDDDELMDAFLAADFEALS